MGIAEREAQSSRDPRTKVGAVIVKVIGRGYNCMPTGQDDDFPWCTRKKAKPNVQHRINSEHKHLYGMYFISNRNNFVLKVNRFSLSCRIERSYRRL